MPGHREAAAVAAAYLASCGVYQHSTNVEACGGGLCLFDPGRFDEDDNDVMVSPPAGVETAWSFHPGFFSIARFAFL